MNTSQDLIKLCVFVETMFSEKIQWFMWSVPHSCNSRWRGSCTQWSN